MSGQQGSDPLSGWNDGWSAQGGVAGLTDPPVGRVHQGAPRTLLTHHRFHQLILELGPLTIAGAGTIVTSGQDNLLLHGLQARAAGGVQSPGPGAHLADLAATQVEEGAMVAGPFLYININNG